MRSAWIRNGAAIALVGVLTVNVGLPSLEAQGPLARKIRLIQGFGEPEPDDPPVPTVHVTTNPTGPFARTWLTLQKPVPMEFAKETPLAVVLKYIKDATKEKDGPTLQLYVDPVGLRASEHNMDSLVCIDLKGVALATSLNLLLRQIGLMYIVQPDGLLVITSETGEDAPLEASEKIHDDLSSLRLELALLRRELAERRTVNASEGERKSARAVAPEKKGDPGRQPEPDLFNQPVSTARVVTSLTAKAAETWTRLQKPLPIHFANETPLSTVIAFLQNALDSNGPTHIPIYVDPIGLLEAECTLDSPVILELDDLPLAKSLELMLRQLGLRYAVLDDGLLTITSDAIGHPPDNPSAWIKILDQVSAMRMEVASLRKWNNYVGPTRRMKFAPGTRVN